SSRYPKKIATLAVLTLVLWAGAKQASAIRLLAREPPTFAPTYAHLLAERNNSLPIAVTHGHAFLPLAEYAQAELKSRLVMIIPSPRIAAKIGASGDLPLIGLSKWVPLRIQDLDSFIAA